MLLSFSLVLVICTVIGLVIGLALILTVAKRTNLRLKIIIVVVCTGAATVVPTMLGKMIHIFENSGYEKMLAFGTVKYDMTDGSSMELTGGDLSLIVNNSTDTLVLVPIIYSISGDGAEDEILPALIFPGNKLGHNSNSIEYLFGNRPPDEIEVRGSKSKTVKYWLTRLSDYN